MPKKIELYLEGMGGCCGLAVKDLIEKNCRNALDIQGDILVDTNFKKATINVGDGCTKETEEIEQELSELLDAYGPVTFSKVPEKFNPHLIQGILGTATGLALMCIMLGGDEFSDEEMIGVTLAGSALTLIIGMQFYVKAWKAGYHVNMYTLIALSTATALVVSILHVFHHIDPDFPIDMPMLIDSALMIFGFAHLNEAHKERQRQQLTAPSPLIASLKRQWLCQKNGKTEPSECDLNDIEIDDIIFIEPGDTIPLDGICEGEDNYSINTESEDGEISPTNVSKNGSLCQGMIYKKYQGAPEYLKIKVTALEKDSALARKDQAIAEAIKNAQMSNNQDENFTDTMMRYFVPAVILLSLTLGVFAGYFGDMSDGIEVSLFTLVVACPCVIGMLSSLAMYVGRDKAKSHVVFKSDKALEAASNIKTVAFDFTGTLTERKFEVMDWKSNGCDNENIFPAVLALEEKSDHLISKAIQTYLTEKSIKPAQCALDNNVPAFGVSGSVGSDHYAIGDIQMMRHVLKGEADIEKKIEEMETFFKNKKTDLATRKTFVLKNKQFVGCFFLKNTPRSDAKNVIETLKKMGKKVVVISGAEEANLYPQTDTWGIDREDVFANCGPIDQKDGRVGKNKKISDLQKEGPVAYFGDGSNDVVAFEAANIGVAVGGKDILQASAYLQGPSLNQVIILFMMAEKTVNHVNWNLRINLIFNALAIGAAGALVFTYPEVLDHPGVGAGMMFIQSAILFWRTSHFSRQAMPIPLSFTK